MLTINDTPLTLDDVVERLKVPGKSPKRTVIAYIKDGKIKARKIGKAWRFHPQAISDFLLGKS